MQAERRASMKTGDWSVPRLHKAQSVVKPTPDFELIIYFFLCLSFVFCKIKVRLVANPLREENLSFCVRHIVYVHSMLALVPHSVASIPLSEERSVKARDLANCISKRKLKLILPGEFSQQRCGFSSPFTCLINGLILLF